MKKKLTFLLAELNQNDVVCNICEGSHVVCILHSKVRSCGRFCVGEEKSICLLCLGVVLVLAKHGEMGNVVVYNLEEMVESQEKKMY